MASVTEGWTARASRALGGIRVPRAAESAALFAQLYLPNHFRLPPSAMHTELFTILGGMTTSRSARLAVAAPRGHAKSTIVSLAYVLWCICYRRESFIILISKTAGQAEDLLLSVKRELMENHRLLGDFPGAAEPPGSKPGPERWRTGEIITRNGVRVVAAGAGSHLRGRRHGEFRPTLIILDDVEDAVDVRSADQRAKTKDWFLRSIAKSGSERTNIVVVGTLLHTDSLLAELMDPRRSPGWTARTYRAVLAWSTRPDLWQLWESIYRCQASENWGAGPEAARALVDAHREAMLTGTAVLWPEKESYADLMELRLREGRASFDAEKQNNPVDPRSCLFPEESFVYWDEEFGSASNLIKRVGDGLEIYGACDPSMGKAGLHHDDSAIVIIGYRQSDKVAFVLEADIRRRSPDEIARAVVEYNREYHFRQFVLEENGFQGLLGSEIDRRAREVNRSISLKGVTNQGDKGLRIQSLQAMIGSGRLRFSRRHTVLLEQLRLFPHAAHDDGPDALEMAVRFGVKDRHGGVRFWVN